MRISVNGESASLTDLVTAEDRCLARVLTELGYRGKKVAVAVNETFVPRTHWSARVIEAGDRLDIVAPIQGG